MPTSAHTLRARAATKQASPAVQRDYAARAGKADDVVKEKTGRTWREWVRVLDADKASALSHREIAVLVSQKHGVPDWWSQTVTVGYERIKGLREIGQRRTGAFEAGKSCTVDVPVAAAYAAWADDSRRKQLLGGVEATVRTSSPSKSMRLQWTDGTIVIVGFTAKGPQKTSVSVVHTKLRDKAGAGRAKEYWGERLRVFAALAQG